MPFFRFFAKAALAAAIAAGAPVLVGAVQIATATGVEAAVLRSIVVRGNQRVDTATIQNYVTVRPGEDYDAADVDASLKSLFDTGLFADVDVTGQGSTIVVVVVENPVVVRVAFSGNRKVRDNTLSALVETQSRGVLSEAQLAADIRRIQDYYQTQGRSSAVVTPDIQQLDGNRVNVVFRIQEGERTRIASVQFEGNDAFPDRRLRSVIQTRRSNILSWLTRRDIYDEAKLAADEELLRRYYFKNGYADFQILGTDVQYDEASSRYTITFTVEEGPRYRFGAINVDSSIPGVDASLLQGAVHTRSGRTFDSTKVEATLEDITVELASQGYAFATVRPRGDRNYDELTIDVTYVIDEGPRVYIERIEIRGNDRTRDYVIRREFDIAEGDAYNRVLLDRVERRLRALNIFKNIAIVAEPGSAPDQVIVVVVVEEESTGEFSVAGGYSTDKGFIAELSLTERNFLGRGQYIRVAIGGARGERTFDLSFTEPYFLGRRMALGFDVYRHVYSVQFLRPFRQQLTGGQIRLGLPITRNFNAELNYKIVQDVVSSSTHALFVNGTALTSSLGYTLTFSTIDNLKDPQDGWYFRVGQDFAGVGGTQRFIRTVADARVYQELWPESDLIGFLRVQGGNITGLGQPVRPLDNFFKGSETIRGFATMGYGPRTTDGAGIPVGGKNFWAATAEVQFPIPLIPEEIGLRGAVFADAGMLFGVDTPLPVGVVSDTALRSSVGGSILWNSPFGLLRADFARVLSSQAYDRLQFFRFSAGAQF